MMTIKVIEMTMMIPIMTIEMAKKMMMKKRQMVKMIRKVERKMIFRSVKDIDLYTGGLAETPVSGAVIGPTFLVSSTVEIVNLLFFLLFCNVL